MFTTVWWWVLVGSRWSGVVVGVGGISVVGVVLGVGGVSVVGCSGGY